MTVEVIPVEGLPEIRPGDDLPALLSEALRDLRSGDVLAVTQKIVSKAEGRIVPEAEGHDTWVARETRRVVARRGDVVIAETHHGFVCANAGVDASNVEPGSLALLPVDPDASADAIRARIAEDHGVNVGVVVTDTFGRPWRRGLVNVAIGCTGLPALVDLRGTKDHVGRVLESTIVALADEVAAASGLVMGKDAMTPAAIVRGVAPLAPPTGAAVMIRPPDEDLFRESPLESIHARRSVREFGAGPVPREAIEEAVRAACTSPAPHHTRPWLFVALETEPAKRRLLGAMAEAWVRDLRADATPQEVIDLRAARSDALLGRAPVLIVPAVSLRAADAYEDERRASAEREMFLLSAGAAVQSLMLALHAQGLASCWVSSTLFCKDETRDALDLDDEWEPMGTVACGWPPSGSPEPPRPDLELTAFLRFA
jgi:dehydro coenzyme F420 reductase / coenzyme F420-0:L-glutamate ligase / coenzyme F420-1:gamma-L-glutamate ligase